MTVHFRQLFVLVAMALFFSGVATAQTAGFDPEAATRAYLATVNSTARAKSDAYFEGGYWLILWGAVFGITIDYVLLRSGLSTRFRDWARRVTKRTALTPALYALPYVSATALILLPWTIYTGFFRERHYDLMNQSFGDWGKDQLIGVGVGMVGMALILMAIFAVIRRSPKRWWLWAALTMTAISAFGAMIIPVFLSPLFNTYTEMKPGPLRDRIVAMAAANNVPASNIYVFDASKQSKKISANVSGLGPTIRISLNDNLLNRTTPDEVVAVMGHELGHYVLHHIWTGILAFAIIFLLGFWLVFRLAPLMLARFGERWGVCDVADPAALPILSMIMSGFFFVMTPVTNSITRSQESQADAFGLDASRQPDAEAKIALMLGEYRKLAPGPLEEVVFFDHPSGEARIRMAMNWKARELAKGVVRP
jgi:STE24 endopeptidase